MQLDINNIPDKIAEAKNYLDYNQNEQDLNNHVFVNYDKVHNYRILYKELMDKAELEFNISLTEITGEWHNFDLSVRRHVMFALTRIIGIPENEITKYGKPSLASDVIQKLYSRYRHSVLYYYLEYSKYKSLHSGLKHYAEYAQPIAGFYSNEGDRLAKFKALYGISETYRYQTSTPNFQGINELTCDIISAPEGWVVVQVDSGQIEPKIYYSTVIKDPMINWLITQYDDVYFALADYCLRDSTDYNSNNLFLHPHVDKSHRGPLKTLVNAGAYGSTLGNLKSLSASIYEDSYYKTEEGKLLAEELGRIPLYNTILADPSLTESKKQFLENKIKSIKEQASNVGKDGHWLAERYYSRLAKHPHRVAHEEEIVRKINKGEREVTSVFGDSRIISGDYNYLKNCFLNNPIQMASARLSAISICKAFEFINSDERIKKSVIYAFNKHDEDVFFVRKEVVDHVAPILKDLRAYEIEGWLPIKSDCTIGLNYFKD